MDRVVLDTNQIVSGLLMRRGAQAALLDAWQDRQFLLIASPPLLTEIKDVLARPHLQQKYRLKEEQVERFMHLLEQESLHVPGLVKVKVCRNPDDDPILACAVEGQADFLITGDEDLLILKKYQQVHILTARHYLNTRSR